MLYDKQQGSADIGRQSCLVLPRCSVCDQVPSGGIRDGIRLRKAFICSACERLIVQSDVASGQYRMLINKLKKSCCKKLSTAGS